MSTNILEINELIEFARKLGAVNIAEEDEAIAFCLNRQEEEYWAPAFARLHAKYYDILRGFLGPRYQNLSTTGIDMICDKTYDRILKWRQKCSIRTSKGSLTPFVFLIGIWEAKRVARLENRRISLMSQNFQELWCVQRDEADAYRGDAVTEKDTEELLAVIERSVDPSQYPGASHILEAISAIYLNSNGMQVRNLPLRPNVTGIKRYLDEHGFPSSDEEIKYWLKVLRARAKAVLEDNGWELNPISKDAQ